MSRVHDALRRAEQLGEPYRLAGLRRSRGLRRGRLNRRVLDEPPTISIWPWTAARPSRKRSSSTDFWTRSRRFLSSVAPESHLIDLDRLHEMPGEEFRSLRTRLNHIQGQQNIHSVVVTSASPAEGKTFTAANLAMAQAQLAENAVLLADFDLRRPVIHNLFQAERSPGLSDYLLDGVPLESAIKTDRLNTTCIFLPAGSPVKNPLELLNLRQVRTLVQSLPRIFNWVIIDTPPLLFSADANLMSTITDGTLMVVRIGATTYDNVIRAMQSLCENNVLGIVANGARASELYSKYTYYYSKQD